jgi:hypothetical protein
MSRNTINRTDPTEVAARCAELGFALDVLTPTIDVWIAGMNSGTPLHAENFAGTIAWHEAVRTIREEGLRHGLERLSREGVQLCVNHTTRTAVVIAQGDARTGDVDNLHIKPSTKYPRGPVSRAVLSAQLSLFPEVGKNAKTDPFEVRILLLHMPLEGDTRAELSLPSLINDDGAILDWHERIFLGSFRGNDLPVRGSLPTDLSPTENVVIALKKRS